MNNNNANNSNGAAPIGGIACFKYRKGKPCVSRKELISCIRKERKGFHGSVLQRIRQCSRQHPFRADDPRDHGEYFLQHHLLRILSPEDRIPVIVILHRQTEILKFLQPPEHLLRIVRCPFLHLPVPGVIQFRPGDRSRQKGLHGPGIPPAVVFLFPLVVPFLIPADDVLVQDLPQKAHVPPPFPLFGYGYYIMDFPLGGSFLFLTENLIVNSPNPSLIFRPRSRTISMID